MSVAHTFVSYVMAKIFERAGGRQAAFRHHTGLSKGIPSDRINELFVNTARHMN
jgi:hypothetical protein